MNTLTIQHDHDAELLQRRFRTPDPLGVPHLVDDLPSNKTLKFTIYARRRAIEPAPIP
jgi:hypothetical protein